MLKGKSVIELTDVHTGEVEVIEEENMVTNALQHIFNPMGYVKAADPMYTTEYVYYYTTLTGGLLLLNKTLEEKGYYMRPFGKERQVFISHSSKDKKDAETIIPYLNGHNLPVWFDKYSISVGDSITENVQMGIEESDMVVFWVTAG